MRKNKLLAILAIAFLVTGCAQPAVPGTPIATGPFSAEAAHRPACTSFCLDSNGYSVHGANLEHQSIYKGLLYLNRRNVSKESLDPSTNGEYAAWISKYGSVTFNLVGYEFAWGGMNEAGLTLSTMSLRESQGPAPDERPPLDEPFYAQYLLDNCATVGEVIASDALVRILNPVSHYLICDRTGACTTVEFLNGRTIYHTGDELPVKALTNNSYRDSLRAWRKGKLSNQSLVRFGIAADRAQNYASAGAESAIDYAFGTLHMADGDRRGGPSAQWSIVFDTANLRIYFRTKRNPRIRTIEFDKIDFSCEAPVLMLDIHESLAGDISDRLEPYSNRRTVDHFVQFFDVWGMDISRDRTEALVEHLEAFSCASPDEHLTQPLTPAPSDAPTATPVPSTNTSVPPTTAPDPRPLQAGRGSRWVLLIASGLFIPVIAGVWFLGRRRLQHQRGPGNGRSMSGG